MRARVKPLGALAALIILGTSIDANAGLFGLGGTSWKEEVLLHDGSKIVVERNMTRHGRHEPGRKPPIGDQSIEFTVPGTNRTLTWHDEYSEDVGSANFNPIALHILNGTPYIVNTAYGCTSYNKWGRPNPPYIIFKHDGKAWQRVQTAELPAEFKTINLVIAPSNEEKRLNQLGTVPVMEIDKMNRRPVGSQYRTILREPMAAERIIEMCDELELYRGHWIQRGSAAGRYVVDGIIERKSK